jgi:hypothetical protein
MIASVRRKSKEAVFSPAEQSYVRQLQRRPVVERIELAEQKVRGLWDYIIDVCKTHENNRVISRSDRLAGQVPPSHAVHALKNLQRGLLHYEIIRLAALWDGPRADRLSIPTIIAIVSDRQVLQALYRDRLVSRRAEEARLAEEVEDGAFAQALAAHAARSARQSARSGFHRDLRDGLALGIRTMNGKDRRAVASFRDRNIAHNLALDPVSLRLSQVDRLLRTTTLVGNGLYGLVLRSGFAIDDSRRYARRCTESLWRHCTMGEIDY